MSCQKPWRSLGLAALDSACSKHSSLCLVSIGSCGVAIRPASSSVTVDAASGGSACRCASPNGARAETRCLTVAIIVRPACASCPVRRGPTVTSGNPLTTFLGIKVAVVMVAQATAASASCAKPSVVPSGSPATPSLAVVRCPTAIIAPVAVPSASPNGCRATAVTGRAAGATRTTPAWS